MQVEGRRQPTPFRANLVQAAQQEPPRAKMTLDHRERQLDDFSSLLVLGLRLRLRHVKCVLLAPRRVLVAADLATLAPGLQATLRQRSARTSRRLGLVPRPLQGIGEYNVTPKASSATSVSPLGMAPSPSIFGGVRPVENPPEPF